MLRKLFIVSQTEFNDTPPPGAYKPDLSSTGLQLQSAILMREFALQPPLAAGYQGWQALDNPHGFDADGDDLGDEADDVLGVVRAVVNCSRPVRTLIPS